MHMIKVRKWTCAGHIASIQDNRWTSQVTDWRFIDGSLPRGRPLKGWLNEIDAVWICYMEATCPRQIVFEKQC